jgi:hypothetical protein
VDVDKETGKILTKNEQSSVPSIYAIGDVQHGAPELTPTAIRAGILLARRLFGNATEYMDYENVPTTVFTPLEYGMCGLGEELANERYGAENVEVFHSTFRPLEWSMRDESPVCYCKLVTNKRDHDRVLGIHIVSPNAGDIIQGFAVAMKVFFHFFSLGFFLEIINVMKKSKKKVRGDKATNRPNVGNPSDHRRGIDYRDNHKEERKVRKERRMLRISGSLRCLVVQIQKMTDCAKIDAKRR